MKNIAIRFVRSIWYRVYIRWLALLHIPQVNGGDLVIHNGCERRVLNGVVDGCWTLSDPWEELVPRSDCRKVWTVSNCYGSYRASVRFYTGYWLRIWIGNGIEPWVRALKIWPRRATEAGKETE